jgi:aspartyl-tRNA(Asn)/glutamyl-tRNA(Gln) amidotransferase subunit A
MASENDLAYLSAVSLLDLYRRRELSPVEATRRIFDRLDALQPRLNAFCVVDRGGALPWPRRAHPRSAGYVAKRWGGSTAFRSRSRI